MHDVQKGVIRNDEADRSRSGRSRRLRRCLRCRYSARRRANDIEPVWDDADHAGHFTNDAREYSAHVSPPQWRGPGVLTVVNVAWARPLAFEVESTRQPKPVAMMVMAALWHTRVRGNA